MEVYRGRSRRKLISLNIRFPEIRESLVDVSGASEDILYSFIGCKAELSEAEAKRLMTEYGLDEHLTTTIFNLLLWYGFLGIRIDGDSAKYIYDFNYKMPLMHGIIKKKAGGVVFFINEAFWPSLMIDAAHV